MVINGDGNGVDCFSCMGMSPQFVIIMLKIVIMIAERKKHNKKGCWQCKGGHAVYQMFSKSWQTLLLIPKKAAPPQKKIKQPQLDFETICNSIPSLSDRRFEILILTLDHPD